MMSGNPCRSVKEWDRKGKAASSEDVTRKWPLWATGADSKKELWLPQSVYIGQGSQSYLNKGVWTWAIYTWTPSISVPALTQGHNSLAPLAWQAHGRRKLKQREVDAGNWKCIKHTPKIARANLGSCGTHGIYRNWNIDW